MATQEVVSWELKEVGLAPYFQGPPHIRTEGKHMLVAVAFKVTRRNTRFPTRELSGELLAALYPDGFVRPREGYQSPIWSLYLKTGRACATKQIMRVLKRDVAIDAYLQLIDLLLQDVNNRQLGPAIWAARRTS